MGRLPCLGQCLLDKREVPQLVWDQRVVGIPRNPTCLRLNLTEELRVTQFDLPVTANSCDHLNSRTNFHATPSHLKVDEEGGFEVIDWLWL